MDQNQLLEASTERHVRCLGCGKTFPIDSDDYLVVWGNVTRGQHGGIVGNNLDEDGVVRKVSVFCHSCFKDIPDGLAGMEGVRDRADYEKVAGVPLEGCVSGTT